MAELTDKRISELWLAAGIQWGRAVAGPMEYEIFARLLLAEVADQEPVARVGVGPFAGGHDEPWFQFIEGKTLPDGVHDLYTRPQAPEGWRPIESAPKDGAPILLAVPDMDGWQAGAWRGSWSFLRKSWAIHSPSTIDGKAVLFTGMPEPTHWMPLPPAPKGEPG